MPKNLEYDGTLHCQSQDNTAYLEQRDCIENNETALTVITEQQEAGSGHNRDKQSQRPARKA